ncbi:uncharacterized protein VTP21DRAFT_10190 [Calcarisporiella thermophila]|uniref:uncharacterized protein n=1 Tax=Calcarisporiella thermophila TaxID=911321 RepID=UPI003741F434
MLPWSHVACACGNSLGYLGLKVLPLHGRSRLCLARCAASLPALSTPVLGSRHVAKSSPRKRIPFHIEGGTTLLRALFATGSILEHRPPTQSLGSALDDIILLTCRAGYPAPSGAAARQRARPEGSTRHKGASEEPEDESGSRYGEGLSYLCPAG